MTASTAQRPLAEVPAAPRRFLARVAWLALVWVGLNGTDARSWLIGVPAVVAAAWISVRLLPAIPWRCAPREVLSFAAFFLRESLRGGWQVAWLAVSPRLELNPAIVRYPLRLPPGPARLFFCCAISLLPGTAVVAISDRHLIVHVLAHSSQAAHELAELEDRVARLFGQPRLGGPEGAG